MKFIVDASEVKAAIATAGRVVPAKSPWPIFCNLYIDADKKGVTFRGSNGDLTFEAFVPAQVEEQGRALLNFQMLAKFIGAAKSEKFEIATEDQKATVKSGRGRIALACAHVDDYPHYAKPDGAPVDIGAETFLKALRYCTPAASDEEVKYHIKGVNLVEHEGDLDLWATDGKIVNHATISGVPSVGGGGQIPKEGVAIVLAMAAKAEVVSFLATPTGWLCEVGSVRAWGKVVDGTYPDVYAMTARYKAADPQVVALVNTDDVSEGINVAICGADQLSDRTRSVVVRTAPGQPIILRGFRHGSSVIHPGRVEIEAEVKSEKAFVLSANYLSETIAGMDADEIAIESDGGAFRITPRAQDSLLIMETLMMPIRATEAEMADV